MEELINKSDEQFKDYLVKITDYKEDASKRDPLIKKLSRPKIIPATANDSNNTVTTDDSTPEGSEAATIPSSTTTNSTNITGYNSKAPKANNNATDSNHKPPAASLNSSTYSSAASSSSSSSSSSSTASDSSTSSSSTHSVASSTYSSPNQSQSKKKIDAQDGEKLEMVKMEELGRTAEFLEHHQVPTNAAVSKQSATTAVKYTPNHSASLTAPSKITVLTNSITTDKENISKPIALSQLTPQKYATYSLQSSSIDLAATTSGSNSSNKISADVSWKTISGRRDKRRKKPIEKIVLTEDIPGHRGDTKVAVDDLVNYIESNNSSNGTNKNNKSKPQNNSKVMSNNQKSHPGVNTNDSSTTTTTNTIAMNSSNNNGNTHLNNVSNNLKKNNYQSSNVNGNSNSNSTNKPQQHQPISSKMNNISATQAKNSPQRNHQPLPLKYQDPKPQPVIEANRETNDQQIKISFVSKHNNHPQQQQPKRTTLINGNANDPKQTSQQQYQRRPQQQTTGHLSQPQQQIEPLKQQLQQTQNPSRDLNEQPQVSSTIVDKQQQMKPKQTAVVTFANHIPLLDEGLLQCTFGFFDEQHQTNKKVYNDVSRQAIATKSCSTTNSNVNNLRQQQSVQNESITKPKAKQSKASLNSEAATRYKSHEVDANSFNYEQILKFISDGWAQTSSSSNSH